MDENSREEIKNRINTKINGNLPMEGCNQNLVLITITIVGCAGQFKFLIKQDDLVLNVIKATLKSYARQGWLPKLSSNAEDFVLYCQTTAHSCLSPTKTIESCGGRHFILKRNTNVGLKSDKLKSESFNWKSLFVKKMKSHKMEKSLEEMTNRINPRIHINLPIHKNNLVLITIAVVGCVGNFRFVVKQDDLVLDVIKKTLKSYARQGRLPQLGSNAEDFDLCCRDPPYSCLSLTKTIESYGGSHFILKRNTNVGLKGDKLKSESFNWKSLFVKKMKSHKMEKSLEEMTNRINPRIHINLPIHKNNLVLITIAVVGCAGNFRFVVKQEDLVLDVIQKTLKSYARQGRLPQLGSNAEDFDLCSRDPPYSCLSLTKTIESYGGSHFILKRNTNVGLKGEKLKSESFNWKSLLSKGNFRFVVKQDDLVLNVIQKTLKSYARQGWLPQLGSNAEDFDLCCRDPPYSCLSPTETIGSSGGKHFLLKMKGDKPTPKSFDWKFCFKYFVKK
ncbi:hypothetical protein K1719_024406 [Acacia pycnantha]|nr:hypothetical protein K1719_024406 [Acacia pycnantha]